MELLCVFDEWRAPGKLGKAVRVLAIGLVASTAARTQTSGTWKKTGNMKNARDGASATLLKNGHVLVAGGDTSNGPSAELYNPANGQWTATGSMSTARAGQFAALLPSGQPLVFFGSNDSTGTGLLTSAELYDP